MFTSTHSAPLSNMVAINGGHNQLTGASKDEYPKWTRSLRVLLNSLRCLDTECGDKTRVDLGKPILPENYGKPRGKITQDLLDSDAGEGLKVAGFHLGDTLITGPDRREWIKARDLKDRERKTVTSSILLLAKPDSPLYLVLLEASRTGKDPNILIEAAENLYNAPNMATCLSIVASENKRISELQTSAKMGSLPATRAYRQIERESQIQFLNVFTDAQKETSSDLLKILQLKNFCFHIDNLENIMKDDPHALQFISQYVRGHKGPPLEFDQEALWRDLDAHLAVFHDSNRKKLSPAAQGVSSIRQEDADLLRHVKVLKRGRPGSVRYRAAVKALGINQDAKPDILKRKGITKDPKDGSGVCYSFRDKGSCKYGSKCRYSHDLDLIRKTQEEKASLNVFSVSLANDESDSLLVAKARDSQSAGKVANGRDFSTLDPDSDYFYDAEVSDQSHYDEDCGLEIQNRNKESSARIDMLSASKRSKTLSQE